MIIVIKTVGFHDDVLGTNLNMVGLVVLVHVVNPFSCNCNVSGCIVIDFVMVESSIWSHNGAVNTIVIGDCVGTMNVVNSLNVSVNGIDSLGNTGTECGIAFIEPSDSNLSGIGWSEGNSCVSGGFKH